MINPLDKLKRYLFNNVPARQWMPSNEVVDQNHNKYYRDGWTDIFKYIIDNKNINKKNIEFAKYLVDSNSTKAYDSENYLDHADGLHMYLFGNSQGRIEPSKYKPSLSKDKEKQYYKFKSFNNPNRQKRLIDSIVGKDYNKVYKGLDPSIGEHFISKGHDKNGDYVSYYDIWDYNPNIGGGDRRLDSFFDYLTGGKPFEIYDRIYLNDYYGLPKSSNYFLPEVEIYPQEPVYKKTDYKTKNKEDSDREYYLQLKDEYDAAKRIYGDIVKYDKSTEDYLNEYLYE